MEHKKYKVAVIVSYYKNATLTPIMCDISIKRLSEQENIDYCIIAVNDATPDNTIRRLKKAKIPNLFLLNNNKNKGLTKSLIRGVEFAKKLGVEYIAIQDADDYSTTNRFFKQSKFLDTHPGIDVVGSYARIVNKRNEYKRLKEVPLDHEDIVELFKIKNSMIHSSVMIRSKMFDDIAYNHKHYYAQDYGLWTQAVVHGFKFANLSEPLVTRCKHRRSISVEPTQRRVQRRIFLKIRTAYLKAMQ